LLVRPLNPKWYMTPEELAHEKKLAHEKVKASEIQGGGTHAHDAPSKPLYLLLAWAAVSLPLAWGVYRTSLTVAKFF
ncbi:MAG: MFS transporter small subunit, partial [Rhodoferax sp.]